MARSRREFDDDRYERTPRRGAPASGGNTAVKVLAVIGAVLLGFGLICGGLIYYAMRSVGRTMDEMREDVRKDIDKSQADWKAERENGDKATSAKAVNEFMNEVKGSRLEAAYLMTSADFKRRMSLAQFQDFVKAKSGSFDHVFQFHADVFAPKSANSFAFKEKAIARGGGGFVDIAITVVKEGGGWKVDQFSVEGEANER